MVSDLNISDENISDLFHCNCFGSFYKQYMVSDLNTSDGKISDFISLQLLGFILVMKLRNVDFEGY